MHKTQPQNVTKFTPSISGHQSIVAKQMEFRPMTKPLLWFRAKFLIQIGTNQEESAIKQHYFNILPIMLPNLQYAVSTPKLEKQSALLST